MEPLQCGNCASSRYFSDVSVAPCLDDKVQLFPRKHIAGHKSCPACDGALEMHRGLLSPQLKFAQAFDLWIQSRIISQAGLMARARYISARTERDLRQYARAAALFFCQLSLAEIHAGHFREYQRLRALNPEDPSGRWWCVRANGIRGPFVSRPAAESWIGLQGSWHVRQAVWERAAGANLILKEVQLVARVIRAAGAWSQHLEEHFEPVRREESDTQRAMSPEEQHAWLHAAASRPEWRVVYWWSLVALQTTMSTNEMRALRIGDISLEQGCVQVRSEGAKNRFRIRTIPLQTPEVAWAFGGLIDRARDLGATGLHCYLMPFHLTQGRYDPERPMTVWGLRKPWDAVRKASGIGWLRPYDLRHTAITRMAEAGVPIQVIMAFAGHLSPRMQQHYTAISMEAKRRWAAAAWATAAMPAAPGLPQSQPVGAGRWVWTPEDNQQDEGQSAEIGEREPAWSVVGMRGGIKSAVVPPVDSQKRPGRWMTRL